MNTESASTTKNEETNNVSLNALRGQALQRLAGVHERLEARGIGAAFLRAAKVDPVGDMGFLGSLIANMLLGGVFADFLGAHVPMPSGHHGMMSDFNGVAVAATEGLSLVRDLDSYGLRSRIMYAYPEGRRKCAMKEANVSKKFNLVSANQNNKFSLDAQAEMACMFEILDILDRLEAQDVRGMRLDGKEPVYDVLKQIVKKARSKDTVKNFATPMLAAV